MDENRIKGKVEQAKGKLKDIGGAVTGDTSKQVEGKVQKAAGRVQEGVGKLKDELRAEKRRQEEPGRDRS